MRFWTRPGICFYPGGMRRLPLPISPQRGQHPAVGLHCGRQDARVFQDGHRLGVDGFPLPVGPVQRNFTLLVLGQISSLFGNYILRLALSMYVLEVTGSPLLRHKLYTDDKVMPDYAKHIPSMSHRLTGCAMRGSPPVWGKCHCRHQPPAGGPVRAGRF